MFVAYLSDNQMPRLVFRSRGDFDPQDILPKLLGRNKIDPVLLAVSFAFVGIEFKLYNSIIIIPLLV